MKDLPGRMSGKKRTVSYTESHFKRHKANNVLLVLLTSFTKAVFGYSNFKVVHATIMLWQHFSMSYQKQQKAV